MAENPRVSPALRALLETHRDAINARFAMRARDRRAEPMLAYLARTVDPLVAMAPEGKAHATFFALFDAGLAGMARGLVGEDAPSPFEEALVALAPRLGAHWSENPARLLVAVGNAFDRLSRELDPGAARRWFELLATIAPLARTRGALLDAGLVLAWRGGIASAREAALARIQALDASIVQAIFGAPAIDPSPERRFVTPGIAGPLGPIDLIARVGGFAGFGGPFKRPPLVAMADGRMIASDGDVAGEVFADRFGAELRPSAWAADAFGRGSKGEACDVDPAGRVRWSGGEGTFPLLRGARYVAAGAGLAGVTLEDSHFVFVLGRRERRPS